MGEPRRVERCHGARRGYLHIVAPPLEGDRNGLARRLGVEQVTLAAVRIDELLREDPTVVAIEARRLQPELDGERSAAGEVERVIDPDAARDAVELSRRVP